MELRHLLVGLGEKMTEEEVEVLIHGKEDAQVDFLYLSFIIFLSLALSRSNAWHSSHLILFLQSYLSQILFVFVYMQ